jgi:hypothetical protein
MVVLAPTMGCTHGYSWFDPRHGGQAFQDHSIEASINVGVIYLIHRPRSGQTINSHW